MIVLGNKIAQQRQKKKMSQKQLAKGICAQSKISAIENRNRCDEETLLLICKRLELEPEECLDIDHQKLVNTLDMVETLCINLEHEKAYEILQAYTEKLEYNSLLSSKLNFYKGITALLGKGQSLNALYYFHTIKEENEEEDIYYMLAINCIGLVYYIENQIEMAKKYYDKSLDLLLNCSIELPIIAHRIYYNSAKFYSDTKQYKIALYLAEKGIQMVRKSKKISYLALLTYELAFNKHMLKQDALLDYKTAYYVAKYQNNERLASVIQSNMKKFNLDL